MADYSVTITENILQDDLFEKIEAAPDYSQFYAGLCITKRTFADFGIAWTIYKPNLSGEFWARLSMGLIEDLTGEFWGKLRVTSNSYRLYGAATGYISGVPINGLSSNIVSTFNYVTVNSNRAEFSISINHTGSDISKISIKLVGRDNDKITASDNYVRNFVYKESLSNYSTTTYGRVKYIQQDFSSDILVLDNSFEGLQDGEYELIVTCWQENSGNIYVAGEHFKVGGQQQDISISCDVQQGVSPLSVQFTSSCTHPNDVSYILWEFEPGVTKTLPNTSAGRNPLYVYKKIGYHYPVVTYVLKNGYKISRGIPGLFEESV